jgi:hypothetical protein
MSQDHIARLRTRRMVWAVLGAAAPALFIVLDHQRMPSGLLPAEWYCHLGAGQWVTETRPTGSTMGGTCDAAVPRCATTSTTTRYCRHGTVWGAILGRPFYVAP